MEDTLNLNNDDIKSSLKYFDSFESMEEIIDKSKMIAFTHKAKNVSILGAKDTGKSFPVETYKIMAMEKDPYANGVTLMKYATAAGKKGTSAFREALNAIKRAGFTLKREYEAATDAFYRLPKGKKSARTLDIKHKSQKMSYESFEDSDRIAGVTIPNLGSFFICHIEEPVLQNDTKETKDEEWVANTKTIEDTIIRKHTDYRIWYESLPVKDEKNGIRDYKGKNIYRPLPFKNIITMNGWEPDHKVQKDTERFNPQHKFLDWALGVSYSQELKMWEDKINGQDMIEELKEFIDKHWEDIKKSVLINHTKWVYVEYDDRTGERIDWLFGRNQKFANPRNRNDELSRENTYHEMYTALVTGDSLRLAKAFGMDYDGLSDGDRRFNFKSFRPENTDKILEEKGRKVLGLSVGWDHDVNRGPVATVATISGISTKVGDPFDYEREFINKKVLVHEQVPIEGYGKGELGKNNKFYQEKMVEISRDLYNKYYSNGAHTSITFDDDDGTYVSHIVEKIEEIGYNNIDFAQKHGKIEEGGFGIIGRDKLVEIGIDIGDIIIDNKNKELISFLKLVPGVTDASGIFKRSLKGKWGKRGKDFYDSMCYALYFYAIDLFEGLDFMEV